MSYPLHECFQMNAPNSQYNINDADSLAIKIANFQRRRMYDRFLRSTGIAAHETLLDVGVTSDQTYASSNYVEAWYPAKNKITAVGIDDAKFLEQLYPGLRFIEANGLNLPFEDASLDVVHSSAVLEHVGSNQNQVRLISECARVARRVAFFTTPNRWFPVEFHTSIPLLHWLPKSYFRALMRRAGREFFADENNLNLMGSQDLRQAAQMALPADMFTFEISSATLAGWTSNLLLTVRRKSTMLETT